MLNDWRFAGAGDPELAELWVEYNERGTAGIDDIRRQRLQFYLTSLWSIYEQAYFSRNYGTLGLQESRRFLKVACEIYLSEIEKESDPEQYGEQSITWATLGLYLTEEFVRYIETSCGSGAQ